MAVGLPVVATSLAAEGMSLTHGENILVADSAEVLADTLARIYQDETLWSRISQKSLTFAEQAWGPEAAWGILASILADMGIKVKRSTYPLSLYSELSVRHVQSTLLQAIGSARDRAGFIQILSSGAFKQCDEIAQQLLAQANTEAFTVDGICVPCDKKVSLLVDMQSGGQTYENRWMPNWRERLECPLCLMNNRQRLIATLLKQELSEKQEQQVYLMEQVTPIFSWAARTFGQHRIIGSEYLGYEYPGGTIVKGIRHEDIENLSFTDNQLDLIVSNDVFEHVPNPAKAFAECARVLKTGGVMLATIPFHSDKNESVIRAKLNNNQLEHFLPPAFHGNPVSTDGSLVFTDFGWDLLTAMKDAGFSDVAADVYASAEFGHLGGGQLVFRALKKNYQSSVIDLSNKGKALNNNCLQEKDSSYQLKIQQELAIYENKVNVHDLPDIYHYWSNKYLAPIFHEAGISSIAQFFSSNLLDAASRTGAAEVHFLSIGSGNCDLEIAIARNLIDAGFKNFMLECLEINSMMLERGKEGAKSNGVLENMKFIEADFNTWVVSKKYDGVMANQSLHHVTNLEHLFDQIKNGLHENGSFVISDIIGRNGHQRWPEAMEIVNKYWRELPESHKFNVLLNRLEAEYENWDCSTEGFEGIRAQDVLPLLLQRFECEKFIGFANVIDIFVERCFGHNFNPESEWDRTFIDRVHSEDESGILSGRLKPTHMLAVFVKELNYPAFYSRGLDPFHSVRHQ
jgi:SAM-dependent methyltransferase